ncbi:hypothetical protein J41TS4_45130 [Paenibacillus apis]|uniref:Mor transcription activator domain-containing protein n=1 Tax=Paenibacillus apis TaxID=1792174 RepID=A0A920CMU0_9BACL|nr:hypothetical protein J41TS4_45130 [Paenibacillus apis]
MIVNYKNGKDVLPPRLLKELQSYIQGELLYIPKPECAKASWGELSGTRTSMAKRNENIYKLYDNGHSVSDLAQMFFLSDESIRKIVCKVRSSHREAATVSE